MEDQTIVGLFWQRSEEAIAAAEQKYGGYCAAIARNILADERDREECLSDTWLGAWNSIPPQRPQALAAFLGRITRNLAFNRVRGAAAQKRGGGQLPLVLEELAECVAGGETPEEALDRRRLAEAIDGWLAGLPQKKRRLFVRRYWYADPIAEAARRCGMTEGAAAVALGRLRADLRRQLEKGGFCP